MIRVAIKLLALFLLVYAGVFLGYRQLEKKLAVRSESGNVQADVAATVKKTATEEPRSGNYQVIITRNIFEAVPVRKKEAPKKKEPPPAKVVEKKPEKTKLKLVLHGTVTGNIRDARAIIVDQKAKRQDLYQIGDAIQGALIVAIERGKVTLEVNGEKQILTLEEKKGGKSSVMSPPGVGSPPVKKSTFVMKSSRTAFSRRPRRKTKSPAKVVPHRRISFRQEANDGSVGIEEPEMPLDENDLDEVDSESADDLATPEV